MNFQARLEERIAKCGNPICLGMDPVMKLIDPCCANGTAEDKIKRFYSEILECCLKRNVTPAEQRLLRMRERAGHARAAAADC